MITLHRILLIAGSPTSPSRTAALMDYAATRLHTTLHEPLTDVLHARDLPPADLLHGRYDSPDVKAAAARVAAASGLVIATPVYKAAYTGVLKALLDLLPADCLAGKVVLPIAIGGSAAHSLVVDYALRPVIAALGASFILPGLYLIDKELTVTEGVLQGFATPEGETRVNAAIDRLSHALMRGHVGE